MHNSKGVGGVQINLYWIESAGKCENVCHGRVDYLQEDSGTSSQNSSTKPQSQLDIAQLLFQARWLATYPSSSCVYLISTKLVYSRMIGGASCCFGKEMMLKEKWNSFKEAPILTWSSDSSSKHNYLTKAKSDPVTLHMEPHIMVQPWVASSAFHLFHDESEYYRVSLHGCAMPGHVVEGLFITMVRVCAGSSHLFRLWRVIL